MRYFPRIGLLEAKLGLYPSYAWRGIWEAKQIIFKGCWQSIGDGKTTGNWKDYWVLGHQAVIPHSHLILGGSEEDTLNSLMESDSNRWDVTKVKSLFNLIVAAAEILKILLSLTPHLDKWLWTKE